MLRPTTIAALAVAIGLHSSPAAADEPTRASAAELRDAVDEARLVASVRLLTGHDPIDGISVRTRNIHHPQHRVAGDWIAEQLAALPGLIVTTERFDAEGEQDLFNVIGILPGADPELDPIVVAAHYDSIATLEPGGGWDPTVDPAPGADDDASGIAAVLEVARVLSTQPGGLRRTVRFVAFSAEEYGLLGSLHHVALMESRGEAAALMLALDPIGYDPGGAGLLWFSYDPRWPDLRDSLEATGEALLDRLDVRGVDADLIGGDSRSDHFPFWEAGMPALHLGSFPQPPTYHTVGDDLDVVDPSFLREVTAVVTAFVADEAELLDPEAAGESCGSCAAAPASGTLCTLVVAAAARRRRRCIP